MDIICVQIKTYKLIFKDSYNIKALKKSILLIDILKKNKKNYSNIWNCSLSYFSSICLNRTKQCVGIEINVNWPTKYKSYYLTNVNHSYVCVIK